MLINMKKSPISFLLLMFTGLFFSTALIANNEIKELSLDELFSSLKEETNEDNARKLENQIWISWLNAENDEIDGLMNDAIYFRREYNLSSAIDSLNEVITKVPNYAEAWNQRAIAYFYQGKLDLALTNIKKTLELEPRHFGAMAGRAVIHLKLNQPDLAKKSISEALKIHPFLPERTLFPELSNQSKI